MRMDAIEIHPIYYATILAGLSVVIAWGGSGAIATIAAIAALSVSVFFGIIAIQIERDRPEGAR